MTDATESAEGGTPLAAALAGGVNTISYNQTVTFAIYKRVVLPLDGFVFWILQGSLTGTGALYNGPVYDGTEYNASPAPAAVGPDPVTAQGSLHRTTQATMAEADSNTVATMVFTSLAPVNELDRIQPGTMYVATDPTSGRRCAFSSSRMRYQQAGLWHYMGEAVRSTLATQLIDDPSQLRPEQAVVSNSLAIWLALGTNQPGVPIFPSFAVPQNLPPPYVAVHINEDTPTAEPLQALPLIDIDSNHFQLVRDRVRFTTYGLRSDQALDFQDWVLQQPQDDSCPWGLMSTPLPVMRDQRSQRQPEYQAIAQMKLMDMEVSYYQQRVREIARGLIEEAGISIATEAFPGAVLSLRVTSVGDGSVGLAWNQAPNAAGYYIYMGTAPGSENFSTPAATTVGQGSTTTTITGLTDGVTYYFVAVAYGSNGTKGIQSNEVSAEPLPAAQLSGLSWLLPCLSHVSGGGCTCAADVSNSTTLIASPGTRYDVTFRIRGIMELKAFNGGTNDGAFWQIGGSPFPQNGDNWYQLTISDPPQTYFINRLNGSLVDSTVYSIDYQKTIQVNAGATITMYADSGGDSLESAHPTGVTVSDNDPAHPIVVAQPYDGQFAQIDALLIVPL